MNYMMLLVALLVAIVTMIPRNDPAYVAPWLLHAPTLLHLTPKMLQLNLSKLFYPDLGLLQLVV